MLARMREAGMLDSNPTSHTLEIPSLSDYSSDPPPPSEDGGSDDGAPKVKRTKSKGKKSKAKSASSGLRSLSAADSTASARARNAERMGLLGQEEEEEKVRTHAAAGARLWSRCLTGAARAPALIPPPGGGGARART